MVSKQRAAFDRAITAWNGGDLDGYLGYYADDIRLHGYSPEPMDKASVRGFYEGLWQAISQSRIDVHAVVEEGDTLAVRATMSGVHTGEMAGVPATGRTIHQPVMTFIRMRDEQFAERWSIADFPAVMAQISAP
jgi:steroid delta-isomerase-like uncharacterized protein